MIRIVYNFLLKILPKGRLLYIKNIYRNIRKNIYRKLSKGDLEKILTLKLKIKAGDVVFIHSSYESLNCSITPEEVISLLRQKVGMEGTLLFPAAPTNIRAEDYLKKLKKPFNVKRTPTLMGILAETARFEPDAHRSLHPTNSVVAIGKYAAELTKTHHEDIYPCGLKSPYFKITEFNGVILGLGVNANVLSFFHCIEDIYPNEFPIETRKKEVFKCEVIDENKTNIVVNTLVAHENIGNRNIIEFIKKEVSPKAFNSFRFEGTNYFRAESKVFFNELYDLMRKGKTIYKNK